MYRYAIYLLRASEHRKETRTNVRKAKGVRNFNGGFLHAMRIGPPIGLRGIILVN